MRHLSIRCFDMRSKRKYVTLLVIVVGLGLVGYFKQVELIIYGAVVLLVAGLLIPPFAAALDWFWFKLGKAIGYVVSPVVMILFFYCVLTPFALLKRIFSSEDAMSRNDNGETMWKTRTQRMESGDITNPW